MALSSIKSDESLATTTTADDNSSSNRRLFSSEFLRDVYGAKLLQQLEHADGPSEFSTLPLRRRRQRKASQDNNRMTNVVPNVPLASSSTSHLFNDTTRI